MPLLIVLLNGEQMIVRKPSVKSMVHGRDLLQYVYQHLNLHEYQRYFGLLYCDKEDGRMNWLAEDDSLKDLKMSKTSCFQLGVCFYPQHPDIAIKDDAVKKLFRLQIKEKLLNGDLGCSVEMHALLDGLLAQAELGDYGPEIYERENVGHISHLQLYNPTFLNSGSNPSESRYLRKVEKCHKGNTGIRRTAADALYLATAKKLPFYGFELYEMIDKEERRVLIGLRERSLCLMCDSASGRFVTPVIESEYAWSDLRYCTHTKRRVRIGVFFDGKAIEHVLKVKGKNCCQEIERLFKGVVKYRDAYLGRNRSTVAFEDSKLPQSEASPVDQKSVSRKISAFTASIEKSFYMLRQRGKLGRVCEEDDDST